MILTSGLSYRPCWIIQNPQKMPFWVIQIAKNKVFGHFLELGASDRLQIAHYDSSKWSWQVGSHISHAGSFKNHRNAFLNDPRSQKRGFGPFFSSLVHCFDLVLHILILPSVPNDSVSSVYSVCSVWSVFSLLTDVEQASLDALQFSTSVEVRLLIVG